MLKLLFLVLTLLSNKELETSQDLFEFKAGPSKPHSQIWGEIVTFLVKILKLYQLVEEEASKSSLFFLSANQSPSLSSSLRSRSRGHRIRVSTWKQLDLRFSIRSKEILVKTLPKYLEKETLWNRQMLRRELRRSSLVQIENVEKLLILY